MIRAARDSGADAIKLQFYHATPKFLRQYKDPKIRQIVKDSEFKFFALRACAKYAKRLGLNFVCTPFGIREAIILEEKFGSNWGVLDYIKVRAADWYKGELFDYIGNHTQLDAFISLPNTINEDPRQHIRENYFKDDPSRAQFLYCVPQYPPKHDEMHLEIIREKGFEGFSDHNPDIESALAAIAYRAKIIEKHVILDPRCDEGYVNEEDGKYYSVDEGDEVPNPLNAIDRLVSINFTQLLQLTHLGRNLEVECFGTENIT